MWYDMEQRESQQQSFTGCEAAGKAGTLGTCQLVSLCWIVII